VIIRIIAIMSIPIKFRRVAHPSRGSCVVPGQGAPDR
jgi:hypothetical protein